MNKILGEHKMSTYEQNTELFIKIYRSFLASGGTLEIDQLVKSYTEMKPFLHQNADSQAIDNGAFVYSMLRFPRIIHKIKEIVLAQTDDIFEKEGIHLNNLEEVSAPARRRKMYFDGVDKLYVFINSVTDVDDIVCLLCAYQIEWNKLRGSLLQLGEDTIIKLLTSDSFSSVNKFVKVDKDFWKKLQSILGNDFIDFIKQVRDHHVFFKIKLLKGSVIDYKRASQRWFENIMQRNKYGDFSDKVPVYFVSSNTHSIVNTITGFVNQKEEDLIKYIHDKNLETLIIYWDSIKQGNFAGDKENFLWYVLKKYENDYPEVKKERIAYEQSLGIDFIEAKHILDINVQIIKVSELAKSHLPQKLGIDMSGFEKSEALIFNIDYPLGFGAYMVLTNILQNILDVRSVHILGKASFLNGKLGDIACPMRVYDDHSKNSYIFNNCFKREYFEGFKAGNILVDQYAASTKGTLLHPEQVLKEYFSNGYTILEMENGPYLDAIYETCNYNRYPEGETLSLLNVPIDIGIIHYASDTPFTKAVTLGTRNLGYEGVDATYISSLAILRRIIELEGKRIG